MEIMSTETRRCQSCKTQFTIEPEDFLFYKKINVPPPTFCPECRMIRRMNFRNARVMYKRKVEQANLEVFSSFSPDTPLTIYEQSYWWSGDWDAMQRGKPYDFSRPFFVQLKELMQRVPWPSGYNLRSVNSDYCNNVTDLKNCHLLFNSGFSESSAYGAEMLRCNEVFDSTKVIGCELSYELLDCEKCNRAFFSQDCVGCSEIYFSQNLTDCHNCFGCINLRHKQYRIFNEQYTKAEYKEFLNKINLGSYKVVEEMKEKSVSHYFHFPRRYVHGQNNNNVSGDYLDHSKNTHRSYLCREMEDCKYCQLILFLPSRESYDMTVAGGELCYEVEEGGGYGVKFSWLALPKNLKTRQINLFDMEYSMECFDSSYLFGCIGLKNKQYCILNTQYTKEEYAELVPKVIDHMNSMPYTDTMGRTYKYGEFFPVDLSPFGYNETIAQEYSPLTKKEAVARGYAWRDTDEQNYKATVEDNELPDSIDEVKDSIINEKIHCAHSGKCNDGCTSVFRIIPIELQFYRRFNLPIPRLCSNCRYYQRIVKRNPLRLWRRKCTCGGNKSENGVYQNTTVHSHAENPCPNRLETSYAPEKPEIVYCEQCYNKEVV